MVPEKLDIMQAFLKAPSGLLKFRCFVGEFARMGPSSVRGLSNFLRQRTKHIQTNIVLGSTLFNQSQ